MDTLERRHHFYAAKSANCHSQVQGWKGLPMAMLRVVSNPDKVSWFLSRLQICSQLISLKTTLCLIEKGKFLRRNNCNLHEPLVLLLWVLCTTIPKWPHNSTFIAFFWSLWSAVLLLSEKRSQCLPLFIAM